jgi:hypothetical protein
MEGGLAAVVLLGPPGKRSLQTALPVLVVAVCAWIASGSGGGLVSHMLRQKGLRSACFLSPRSWALLTAAVIAFVLT